MMFLTAWLRKRLENMRFPVLFMVTAALFLLNLFILDPLPFVDEILMLCATALIAAMRRGKDAGQDTKMD